MREFWLREQSQVQYQRLQNQPFYCTKSMLSYDNCVIKWQILQSVKLYLTLFSESELPLFFIRFCKFGIKISVGCAWFSWCTLICIIVKNFWNIVTFTSGKELFLTSLYCQLQSGNNSANSIVTLSFLL